MNRGSLEPFIPDSVEFYPHQIEGVRKLAGMKSWLNADDMGLGKTLQALTVFAMDVYRGWASQAIVICPVTLKGNWADEIDKFTRFEGWVLEGTAAKRKETIDNFRQSQYAKILIVNYEQVTGHLEDLNNIGFDVAIFDEAHYIKNNKSLRTKACLALLSRRSFLLTGTPMLNHVNELWTLLHRISPEDYPKYYSFVNRFAVFGGYKDKQIVGVKNEKELNERLNRVMIRRLKKDVLSLPEVQFIERRVDLLPQQRKLYEQAISELTLPDPNSADPLEIENALTKFLYLKEICGSTFKFTGEDHSSKLDLCIEDDLELLANGEHIVIFTQSRTVQSCYMARMRKASPSTPLYELNGDVNPARRVPLVKQWEAEDKPAVIVCMLQVAGVGLNMTRSKNGAFIDELFVPGLNRQAIDRLNRIGANLTQAIQIRRYIARNTIDQRIQQILNTKTKLFGTIVENDSAWKRRLIQALEEDAA